jgi:hypothetical protein
MNMDLEEKCAAAMVGGDLLRTTAAGREYWLSKARSVLSCLEENGMVVVPRDAVEDAREEGRAAGYEQGLEHGSADMNH